ARLAVIALRAGVAIVGGGAIGRRRVRAGAGGRIARARRVALIRRRAGHGVAARTRARLTRIALRAGVAVVAGGAVGGGRVRTRARGWIACTRCMALIRSNARDWVGSYARAALATVGLRAAVAIVA